MLSDRPYMRGDYQRERTSVLIWLISAIIAGFVIQFLLGTTWLRQTSQVADSLGLSIPALRSWKLWTLLTHAFLHDTRFVFHVVGNVFLLYLIGRELLPMLGSRRFLGLFAATTIVGGLAWALVHWQFGGTQVHLGATAAVWGLFIVFACFFPNQELSFLLLFLFPVTLKPKHVAWTLVAFDLVSLVFWEIPGMRLPYGATIASSAHLGGMLTGFAYYRFVFDAHWFGRSSPDKELELPRWLKRPSKKPVATAPASAPLNTPPAPENIRAEVDRILDKINSQGFAALSPEEKQLLAEARDQITRR